MNKFIKKQLSRTSVRSYNSKPIDKKNLEILKDVINSVSTSINGQAFSAIFIQDKNIKEKISKLNWNQKHIIDSSLFVLFVADGNRIKYSIDNETQDYKQLSSIEHLFATIVDATIAAQACVDASIALGLGTCFIGGVRTFANELIELLNLPEFSFPIVGLTIGYENEKVSVKPKINKVYNETYDLSLVKKEVDAYNIVMKDYFHKRDKNPKGNDNYSTTVAKSYLVFPKYYKKLVSTLRKQKMVK